MAIYDFKCKNEACKNKFEYLKNIKDDTPTLCPLCNTESEKLISVLRTVSSTWKSWRT